MKAEEFAAREPDEVLNQPPALENYNLYECVKPLREAVARVPNFRTHAESQTVIACLPLRQYH